jgi:hypothetical protein
MAKYSSYDNKLRNSRRVSKVVESIFRLVMLNRVSHYEDLTDEEKLFVDSRHPHLASREHFINRIKEFGQVLLSIFGTVYLGVEFSALFSVSIGAVFGFVSLGLFLSGFLCITIARIAQEIFVTSPRNKIIDKNLLEGFKRITELRETTTELRAYINKSKSKFERLQAVVQLQRRRSPQHPNEDVICSLSIACLHYINQVEKLLDENTIDTVIQGILDCRDNSPLDPSILTTEQQQIDFLYNTPKSVSSDELRGHDVKQKRKGSSESDKRRLRQRSEQLIRNPKFVQGWAHLKGELPALPKLDADGDYLMLCHQLNEIAASSVLLEELAHSLINMDSAKKVSFDKKQLQAVTDKLMDYVEHQDDESALTAKTSLPMSRRSRLVSPPLDVPAIVFDALVAQSPKPRSGKSPRYVIPPWLGGKTQDH